MAMNKGSKLWIVVLLVLLLPSQRMASLVAADEHTPVTIETVYNALRNRESRIRSFDFSWGEAITVSKGGFTAFTPPQYQSDKSGPQPPEDTTYDTTYRLVVDGGMLRAQGKALLETPSGGALQEGTLVLKEDRTKSYRPQGPASPYPQGAISGGPQREGFRFDPHLLPLLMVLRPFRYGAVFDRFTTRYSVVAGQQVVRGRKCIAIKSTSDGASGAYNMAWLDTERDYMLVRFSRQVRDKPSFQFDYLEWDNVGSEWLPTEWKRTIMNGDTVNRSARAVVHKHSINRAIDGNEFMLDFPVGTRVSDFTDPKNVEEYIVREGGRKREISRRELASDPTYEQLLNTEPSNSSHVGRDSRLLAALVIPILLLAAWYFWRKRRVGRAN